MSIPLKIAIVGPANSGKTVVANLIADFSDVPPQTYKSTVGVRYEGKKGWIVNSLLYCRILEFERTVTRFSSKSRTNQQVKVAVELWDCSGDAK